MLYNAIVLALVAIVLIGGTYVVDQTATLVMGHLKPLAVAAPIEEEKDNRLPVVGPLTIQVDGELNVGLCIVADGPGVYAINGNGHSDWMVFNCQIILRNGAIAFDLSGCERARIYGCHIDGGPLMGTHNEDRPDGQ